MLAIDQPAPLLPPGGIDALVEAGLARRFAPAHVGLAMAVPLLGTVATAVPRVGWSDAITYVGADSAHLVDAVLRLAPHGDRAAELGTGTGLLAALLARRYRVVVATDVAADVALAAAVTLALNPAPEGHGAGAAVADVAAGLRPATFDLVAANAPWVPHDGFGTAPPLFANGGETGSELPRRFLVEGAALLRPGGVAVTLGLDTTLRDGRRPLQDVVTEPMAPATSHMLPTPHNRQRPNLLASMQRRKVDAARHGPAIDPGRTREPGDRRGAHRGRRCARPPPAGTGQPVVPDP